MTSTFSEWPVCFSLLHPAVFVVFPFLVYQSPFFVFDNLQLSLHRLLLVFALMSLVTLWELPLEETVAPHEASVHRDICFPLVL